MLPHFKNPLFIGVFGVPLGAAYTNYTPIYTEAVRDHASNRDMALIIESFVTFT